MLEKWQLFRYGFTTFFLSIIIKKILMMDKFPSYINVEKTLSRGKNLLKLMIGAAHLLAFEKDIESEKEFPLSIEGLALNHYLFQIINEDSDIKNLIFEKTISGFLKYLLNILNNLLDPKTPEEDIKILNKFILHLDELLQRDTRATLAPILECSRGY
jgi:hypothetical protein